MYAGSGSELSGDDAGPALALDGDPGAAKEPGFGSPFERRSGDAGCSLLNCGC